MNCGPLLAAIAGVEGLHAPVYTDEGRRSLIDGMVSLRCRDRTVREQVAKTQFDSFQGLPPVSATEFSQMT